MPRFLSARDTGGMIGRFLALLILTATPGAAFLRAQQWNPFQCTHRARILVARSQLSVFQAALAFYRADNGSYPTTAQGLQALVAMPAGEPRPERWRAYLSNTSVVPRDPWGNDYLYESPGPCGEDFLLVSYGPDGQPGGKDDITVDADEGTADEAAQ